MKNLIKNEADREVMNLLLKITLAFATLFIFLICISNIKIVDQGEKAVVTTFGKISETWDAGIHLKYPFVQSSHIYNIRIQKTIFGDQENQILSAYSNDQQIIENYKISVTWSYDPARIEDVYKHFGTDDNNSVFFTVVSPTIQQTSKTIFGRFTAQTIVQERAKLEMAMENRIKEQLSTYPIKIISIQIVDINFSESYEKVIEQTAQKKQEIEKAKNELRRIEIETQQQVARAEAENKAIKLKADAEAYQVTVKAKAEADAIRLKGEALKENKDLVDLRIAEKWNGNVPQTMITTEQGKSNLLPLLNIK